VSQLHGMQKMGSWCRGMPRHQLTDYDPIEFPDLALHNRSKAGLFASRLRSWWTLRSGSAGLSRQSDDCSFGRKSRPVAASGTHLSKATTVCLFAATMCAAATGPMAFAIWAAWPLNAGSTRSKPATSRGYRSA
jgi:hypothetical protein